MHISLPTIFAALLVASEVSAGVIHHPRSHHGLLARRINRKKRCIQRGSAPVENTYTATSTPAPAPAPAQTTPADNGGNSNNNNGGSNNNNNGGNNNNNGGGNSSGTPSFGTIQDAASGSCGDPGASTNPTSTGGPNGQEVWLNCGVDGAGWAPPPVYLSNLVYKDLGAVLNQAGSPFAACSGVLSDFESMGSQTGIPAILLASIALQESGCNPGATGPNGEIGLMQITPDKCPSDGSDCYNASTNIGIGANYFQSVLNSSGGNVASAMGQWNGWFPGMTVGDANNHPTCGSRNNLDYLQNVFNGYLQGVDPYSLNMGVYFNTNC